MTHAIEKLRLWRRRRRINSRAERSQCKGGKSFKGSGSLSRYTEGRPELRQLPPIYSAECLQAGRRRHQSQWLVQDLVEGGLAPMTASAGVSYNKFLAKLASGQRKPNGQFVITPEMGADFIASLPVAKFHGIGPVTAARMQRLGIETGADLRAKSLSFLQQHFGKSAAWYQHRERRGRPARRRRSSAQILRLRNHLRARADRARRNRGRR